MVLLGNKKSGFWKFNPNNAKTACIEAVFKNGALSKAIIGLKITMNISS
ncbi:MAG: hypothetical protein IJ218_06190 [Alphaproteobacteria bacterium]|nr:hypothetical protein [Alphaproteobacteria bacterium]